MKVELASAAQGDLARIYSAHFRALERLGESNAMAAEAARRRVQGLAAAAMALANAPARGATRDDILSGLRCLSAEKAEIWYANTSAKRLTILAFLPQEGPERVRQMAHMLDPAS